MGGRCVRCIPSSVYIEPLKRDVGGMLRLSVRLPCLSFLPSSFAATVPSRALFFPTRRQGAGSTRFSWRPRTTLSGNASNTYPPAGEVTAAMDPPSKVKTGGANRTLEDLNWDHSFVRELPGDPRNDAIPREVLSKLDFF